MAGRLTAGQRDWLRVRAYLQQHRHQLSLDAAAGYPADRRIAGTALLTSPGWLPAAPVALADIALEFSAAAGPRLPSGRRTRRRTCRAGPTGRATFVIRTRSGIWRLRRRSRTAPPTG